MLLSRAVVFKKRDPEPNFGLKGTILECWIKPRHATFLLEKQLYERGHFWSPQQSPKIHTIFNIKHFNKLGFLKFGSLTPLPSEALDRVTAHVYPGVFKFIPSPPNYFTPCIAKPFLGEAVQYSTFGRTAQTVLTRLRGSAGCFTVSDINPPYWLTGWSRIYG
jgi:hypothetical protein